MRKLAKGRSKQNLVFNELVNKLQEALQPKSEDEYISADDDSKISSNEWKSVDWKDCFNKESTLSTA